MAGSPGGYWPGKILHGAELGRGRNDSHVALSRYMASRGGSIIIWGRGAMLYRRFPVRRNAQLHIVYTPKANVRYERRGCEIWIIRRLLSVAKWNVGASIPRRPSRNGDKCPNEREKINEENPRRATNCNLMRRCGHKRGNTIGGIAVDGRIQQLRGQNLRERGGEMVDRQKRASGRGIIQDGVEMA